MIQMIRIDGTRHHALIIALCSLTRLHREHMQWLAEAEAEGKQPNPIFALFATDLTIMIPALREMVEEAHQVLYQAGGDA